MVTPKSTTPPKWLFKLLVLAVVVTSMVLFFRQFDQILTLGKLAQREGVLRQYQVQQPILVFGIAFLLYVMVTGLSLPGAAALSLSYGWYFGFLRGTLLVSFASTAGATLAFLLSRYLFRDLIEHRFGDRSAAFRERLRRDGAFYLFTLRLIPAVPFFVINLVMGLTPIRTKTFWWVSQIGMLPGTLVYLYAGSSVPSLSVLAQRGVSGILTTRVIFAFALLGLFPIFIRWLVKPFTPHENSDSVPLAD